MAKQHFFIHSKYYGDREAALFSVHAQAATAFGYAFFCPLCGDLWAHCPVEGQATLPHMAPCERHACGDRVGTWNHGHVASYQVPGSIMLSHEAGWNRRLPLAVLAREFLLHFNQRYPQKGNPL